MKIELFRFANLTIKNKNKILSCLLQYILKFMAWETKY